MFAATYPERTEALILLSVPGAAWARPGYFDENAEVCASWEKFERLVFERWGEGEVGEWLAPTWTRSEFHRRFAQIVERASASPGMARAIVEGMREYDIRGVAPNVRVPTLIIHFRDEAVPIVLARDLAERIPGARFVELPGRDHVYFADDWRPVVSEIEAFVTGQRHEPETSRVLQTVLFTDIVGSTERAAEVGDRRWRELLEHHDRVVRDLVASFGGTPLKSLGDGFLAVFNAPTRAIRCARAMAQELRGVGLELRAGIHTGECERIGEDIGGLAVHIGARIAGLAGAGEVLVSSTVKDLVAGSGIEFTDRGTHPLKGVPGEWRVFATAGG